MSKQYTLNNLNNLTGKIIFNHIDGKDVNGNPLYYVLRFEFYGQSINNDVKRKIKKCINIGNSQSTKFSDREIYTELNNVTNIQIADTLKDLFVDMINVDISQ